MTSYAPLGTTPVQVTGLDKGLPTIQNLGPGNVYIDIDESANLPTSGIKLAAGQTYDFTSPAAANASVWIVADQASTDVRVVNFGG